MFGRRRRKRKGQAILEMALVFPLFLLLIVGGIIDFGFAFYNFLTLQQIANETAQWGAESMGQGQSCSDSDIRKYAKDLLPEWWDGFDTTKNIQIEFEDLTTDSGSKVLILDLSYNSKTYTPFYQAAIQGITGSSTIPLSTRVAYKIPDHFIRP